MRIFKNLFMGVLLSGFLAITSMNAFAINYVADKNVTSISDAVATGDTVTLYDTSSGNSLQATIAQIYSSAANIGAATIVTVGALDSGSITSNFGAIDNGTSNITTGGKLLIDVDGSAIDAVGALSLGANADDALYHDGTNMVHDAATAHDFSIAGTTEGDLAADGMNLITGDTYQINNTAVLSATTLGSGVVSSSLTSLGTITTATVTLANITTLNVSDIARVNVDGSAIAATGSLGFGADTTDSALYWDGTNLVLDTTTALDFSISGTTEGDLAADGMNVIAGDSYQVANTSVLNATTLGSGVVSSSLTSLGTVVTGTFTTAIITIANITTDNVTTLNVSGVATFNGGQTRTETIFPKSVALALSTPPTSTVTTGGSGNVWQVLQFKADGGAFGDGHVSFPWHVPAGYVANSGRLDVIWSCESAETAGDTATFDLALLSVAEGESMDATATTMPEVDDTGWAGTADLKQVTELNFEVLDIAVGDTVYFDLSVDESRSAFADSVDVQELVIRHESTE